MHGLTGNFIYDDFCPVKLHARLYILLTVQARLWAERSNLNVKILPVDGAFKQENSRRRSYWALSLMVVLSKWYFAMSSCYFFLFLSSQPREQIITEWLSRFLGEDECTQSLCGHVDPAFLFSSQASTKIKGPESQFGTRILGFYLLTMWIR